MRRPLLCIVAAVVGGSGALKAAEPQVVFEDRFDGKVADGWSWLREDTKTWRIKDGALEIRVEPGVAPTVKNALLRKAPDRSQGKSAFDVTVTFTAEPTRQFEQAGITWYRDGKPAFKLVHEFIDGKTYIIPGKVPSPAKTVQLRLIVTKDRIATRRSSLSSPAAAGEGRLPAAPGSPAGRICPWGNRRSSCREGTWEPRRACPPSVGWVGACSPNDLT